MQSSADRVARLKSETAAGVLWLKALKEINTRMGTRSQTQPIACLGHDSKWTDSKTGWDQESAGLVTIGTIYFAFENKPFKESLSEGRPSLFL